MDDPRGRRAVVMFPDPREIKLGKYVHRANGVAGFQFTFWNGETRLFDATDAAIQYVVKNFRTDPPPNGKGR
jgi:hypothetical protein